MRCAPLLLALILPLQGGCARLLQAAIDPTGAAAGAASDLGVNQAVSDIDRILAANPDADNAGELQALKQDLSSAPLVTRRIDPKRENASMDHRAEHDRRAPRVQILPDKLRLDSPFHRFITRGSQDRRPDAFSTWAPTMSSDVRRF